MNHPDGDTLNALSNITPAALCRLLGQGYKTFWIDEFDQYSREKRELLLSVRNNGYVCGKYAILCDQHDRNKVKQFPVFGPKVVATIRSTQAAFTSRCIELPMVKNIRRVHFRIDLAAAESLRDRLTEWRRQTQGQPLPRSEELLMKDYAIRDYRLIQIMSPLLAVTPKTKHKALVTIAKDMDEERAQEEAGCIY
ncbi:MAG: hypothetical protein ACXABY_21955, partial [Candidatus Thorarchaeota archaeon]